MEGAKIRRPWGSVSQRKSVLDVAIMQAEGSEPLPEQHGKDCPTTKVRRAMPRRFPPPCLIKERQEYFIGKDAHGQQLAYLYFEDEPQ
jgi:hypothetical protein